MKVLVNAHAVVQGAVLKRKPDAQAQGVQCFSGEGVDLFPKHDDLAFVGLQQAHDYFY